MKHPIQDAGIVAKVGNPGPNDAGRPTPLTTERLRSIGRSLPPPRVARHRCEHRDMMAGRLQVIDVMPKSLLSGADLGRKILGHH